MNWNLFGSMHLFLEKEQNIITTFFTKEDFMFLWVSEQKRVPFYHLSYSEA